MKEVKLISKNTADKFEAMIIEYIKKENMTVKNVEDCIKRVKKYMRNNATLQSEKLPETIKATDNLGNSLAEIMRWGEEKRKDDSKAEDILAILRWRCSPKGTARSGLHFDRESKEILINEDALMQAIQLANPGQGDRKLKLISEEEFRNRRNLPLPPHLEEN